MDRETNWHYSLYIHCEFQRESILNLKVSFFTFKMCIFEGYLNLDNITVPNNGVIKSHVGLYYRVQVGTHVYTLSLPRSAIHCPWSNTIKVPVPVALNLSRRLLESFHLFQGQCQQCQCQHLRMILTTLTVVSTLHFHDNHTPLLEHCASRTCRHPMGRWKWCMK